MCSASFAYFRGSVEEQSQSSFHLLVPQWVNERIKEWGHDSIEERNELFICVAYDCLDENGCDKKIL